MTITERTAQELAELLPDNLDCTDARKRLLSLIELLRAVTDYDHPLSNADIRAVLVAKLGEGAAPSENTLNADIQALRKQGVLGYEVHTGTRGTWCENGAFTPASVRLCLNAVQSSRFLTSDQSSDVQDGPVLSSLSRQSCAELPGRMNHLVRQKACVANCPTKSYEGF